MFRSKHALYKLIRTLYYKINTIKKKKDNDIVDRNFVYFMKNVRQKLVRPFRDVSCFSFANK